METVTTVEEVSVLDGVRVVCWLSESVTAGEVRVLMGDCVAEVATSGV